MKIKLQEILDNKNISVYSLSKQIGVTQNNLGKLIKGETTSIKYDILEKLCNILAITPNDIFEIEPSTDIELKTYRLLNKIRNDTDTNTLSNIGKKYTNSFLADTKMFQGQTVYFSNNLDKNDEILTDDFNLEKIQQKFKMEVKLSNNIFSITDCLIYNADTSDFAEDYITDIEKYKQTPNSIEASRFMLVCRILFTIILNQYKSRKLLEFVAKIMKIYSKNPFLSSIDEDELNTLLNESEYLLNKLNIKQKD